MRLRPNLSIVLKPEGRDIESPRLRLMIPLHCANESINLLNAPVHTNECGSRVAIRHV